MIERLRLRDFSHEYFQNFVTLEGRLWRSLWLLVGKPGQLTLEFIAGRRRRYVRPIPLYLSLSFLMFLLLAFSAPDSVFKLDAEDGILIEKGIDSKAIAPPPHPALRASAAQTGATLDSDNSLNEIAAAVAQLPPIIQPLGQRYYEAAKKFRDDPRGATTRLVVGATAKLPYAVFLLVPAFALNTRLLYRRRARPYSEHFLFAMHLHAFVFLTLIAAYALPADTSAPLLFWCWWGYLTLALRRVFGGRWWVQSSRALLLILGHSVLLAVAAALTLAVSLASV